MINDIIKKLTDNMTADTQTVNDVFSEFKVKLNPSQKEATKPFDKQELDILKPDYGSALDKLKKR